LGLPPIDSWAYTLRGDAYSAKLQFDRAIDDYNEALKLKPNYYAALVGRADTFELQGDHARALEDYNAAIEASPAWSVAYRARGVSELNQNRFQEALDDLHHANVLQPSDPYAVLWMQLVRWKTGAGNGSLATDAKYLDRKVWPWPVVALVQGSMTPDQVLATAKKNDLPSRGHECEALFYVGEYFLAARDPHGKGYIQAAADMCPSTYIEFVGARAELTRLGG
ncbi:MAG TPA: tetratricopeptide repeat protein, partial [Candidatus Limnocylindrales bacterium]|nr:tetratricopeptide repeat protein [Candidatus Limnocylindrales bacterium]